MGGEVMSQGYEMEKHRADTLKGHLDAALGRVESERELNAPLQSRARSAEGQNAEGADGPGGGVTLIPFPPSCVP